MAVVEIWTDLYKYNSGAMGMQNGGKEGMTLINGSNQV